MTALGALAEITLRGLAGRRRLVLMILLAALPVIVALLLRLAGGRGDAPEIIDALLIRTVLPLVALVIGTAAIGSEIDDGTAVFVLLKPIPRWRTALVKSAVASGLTLILVVPPVLLTGLLVAGFGSGGLATTFGYALATMAGGIAYACAFTALGPKSSELSPYRRPVIVSQTSMIQLPSSRSTILFRRRAPRPGAAESAADSVHGRFRNRGGGRSPRRDRT